jgi:hypothetical protein
VDTNSESGLEKRAEPKDLIPYGRVNSVGAEESEGPGPPRISARQPCGSFVRSPARLRGRFLGYVAEPCRYIMRNCTEKPATPITNRISANFPNLAL